MYIIKSSLEAKNSYNELYRVYFTIVRKITIELELELELELIIPKTWRFSQHYVTGVGHSDNNFPVEDVADYPQETPTDAANQVGKLITGELKI